MKREIRWLAATATICTITAALASCSGDDDGGGGSTSSLYTGKTTQATIDEQSVKDTLASVNEVIPSCSATGVAKIAASQVQPGLGALKAVKLIALSTGSKTVGKTVSLISTTAPSTKTGDCGGTLSYPTYSHSSGTTTVSVKWDNYCTTDSSGNKTTYNGTLNAVDVGTPSASGPVTTKVTADIPSLKVEKKNSAGTVLSSETIALNGLEYVPATGASTSNLSGSTKLTSLEVIDGKTGKQYKLEDATLATSAVGTDNQITISAKMYRGTSGYSTITTPIPILIDSNENLKAGAITFTGANGSTATLTASPGTGQNFTVSVNGTTLTGAQLSCSGL